jgi:hypothetical protein
MPNDDLPSESADMELPIPSVTSARAKTWRIALSLSLLLHGSLLATFVYVADPVQHAMPRLPTKTIKAVLSTYNPQAPALGTRKPANPPAIDQSTETPPATAKESISSAPTPIRPATQRPTTITPASPTNSADAANATMLTPLPLDPTSVQQAIRDTLGTELKGQLAAWIDDCQRQRQRNALATCDSLAEEVTTSAKQENLVETVAATFSAYLVHANVEREAKALFAEIESLQPLLEEDSELGVLARQRYQTVMAAYCAMSACKTAANAPRLDPTVSEAIRHDSVVELIGVGK